MGSSPTFGIEIVEPYGRSASEQFLIEDQVEVVQTGHRLKSAARIHQIQQPPTDCLRVAHSRNWIVFVVGLCSV